jgi:hypothetical protein
LWSSVARISRSTLGDSKKPCGRRRARDERVGRAAAAGEGAGGRARLAAAGVRAGSKGRRRRGRARARACPRDEEDDRLAPPHVLLERDGVVEVVDVEEDLALGHQRDERLRPTRVQATAGGERARRRKRATHARVGARSRRARPPTCLSALAWSCPVLQTCEMKR